MSKSRAYSVGDDEFRKIVEEAKSYSDIARRFGLSTVGTGAYQAIKRRIDELGIDCQQRFAEAVHRHRSADFKKICKIPIDLILVENSTYVSTVSLKRRLINEHVLKNECHICGLTKWNGKEISLHLDHINGCRRDQRRENLRLLCPNCHSQTETYAGKNLSAVRTTYKCKRCDVDVCRGSTLCSSCLGESNRKVERPSREVLEDLAWKIPTSKIAKQYGVSDKTVERWCRNYGVPKPPRGYWMKLNAK
jgi:transposase